MKQFFAKARVRVCAFVCAILFGSQVMAQTYAGDPADTAEFFTVPFYDMISKVMPALMILLLVIYVLRLFFKKSGARGGRI